jgi:hypothetical protein
VQVEKRSFVEEQTAGEEQTTGEEQTLDGVEYTGSLPL